MAIEAPISKFKKTNVKIYILFCIVIAVIFAYDGYLSKYKWSGRYNFYKKNVLDNDGKPNLAMHINRISPPIFITIAVFFGIYLHVIKGKKIIAEENELIIKNDKRIPYDSIQRIDKTYFEKKGFFVITYKNKNGKEVRYKLSDKAYGNLATILEHLVSKIT